MLRRPIQLPRIMILTMHTTTTALPQPHTTVIAFSGAVSSTSASPSVSPVSFICSPHLSFANHERQAAQSPEHEGRSREAGFFTHIGSLPFLLTGWPLDPV